VGTQLARRVDEPPQHCERSRQLGDDFGKASDRVGTVIADETAARRFETLTAKPEYLSGGLAPMQFHGKRAGVQIAGRFTARDHDSHWGRRT
jgi:hypothetical protein